MIETTAEAIDGWLDAKRAMDAWFDANPMMPIQDSADGMLLWTLTGVTWGEVIQCVQTDAPLGPVCENPLRQEAYQMAVSIVSFEDEFREAVKKGKHDNGLHP